MKCFSEGPCRNYLYEHTLPQFHFQLVSIAWFKITLAVVQGAHSPKKCNFTSQKSVNCFGCEGSKEM